jgi:hypothetical protein
MLVVSSVQFGQDHRCRNGSETFACDNLNRVAPARRSRAPPRWRPSATTPRQAVYSSTGPAGDVFALLLAMDGASNPAPGDAGPCDQCPAVPMRPCARSKICCTCHHLKELLCLYQLSIQFCLRDLSLCLYDLHLCILAVEKSYFKHIYKLIILAESPCLRGENYVC